MAHACWPECGIATAKRSTQFDIFMFTCISGLEACSFYQQRKLILAATPEQHCLGRSALTGKHFPTEKESLIVPTTQHKCEYKHLTHISNLFEPQVVWLRYAINVIFRCMLVYTHCCVLQQIQHPEQPLKQNRMTTIVLSIQTRNLTKLVFHSLSCGGGKAAVNRTSPSITQIWDWLGSQTLPSRQQPSQYSPSITPS